MILFRSIFIFLFLTIASAVASAQLWPTFFPPDTTTTTMAPTTHKPTTHKHMTTKKPHTTTHRMTTERPTTTHRPTTTKMPTTMTTTKRTTTTMMPTTMTTEMPTTMTTEMPTTMTTEMPTTMTTENTPEIITVTEYAPSTKTPYVTVTFPFTPDNMTTEPTMTTKMNPTTMTTEMPTTPTEMTTTTTEMPTTPTEPTMSPTTMEPTTMTPANMTTMTPSNMTTMMSTTPAPPTPPTPPNPMPPPAPWNVTYGNGTANCIMASFAAKINVQYKSSMEVNKTLTTGFDIPENATVCNVRSRCLKEENNQTFVLNFDIDSGLEGFFKLVFGKNSTTSDSIVTRIETEFKITERLFPGIAKKYLNKFISLFVENATLFDTPANNSYQCKTAAEFILDNIHIKNLDGDDDEFDGFEDSMEVDIVNSTASIGAIHWQSFLPWDKTVNDFLESFQCESNGLPISNVIPITVGVILLTMVTIVLVAYIIGRRRQAAAAAETVNYSQMEE